MKKIAVFIVLACFAGRVVAQCDAVPFRTGMEWSLQSFNAKDKLTGTVNYKVTNLITDMGYVVATVQVDMKDENEKALNSTEYKFKCKGDEFMMDMENFMSGQQMDAYKGMEIKGQAAYLEFPTNLSVGSTLPDGVLHLDIISEGKTFATMDMKVTNRKVLSKESVTVPAGTFSCFKISADNEMKTTTMGMGFPTNTSSIDYFSPGNWFVRSESYNKSQKLLGYTVLSSFKK